MRLVLLSLLSVATAASVIFACKSDSDPNDDQMMTGPNVPPEQLFRALQADLIKNCGGVDNACHINGTHKNAQGEFAAKWLGPGDPYMAAKTYVGIIPITGDPNDSKLLTQIEHDGPALVSIPDLFEKVKIWVTAETAAAGSAHPVTDAFYIKDGPNTVSLASLAAGADGAKLTFDASTLDTNLFLDNMKITAPAGSGLSIDTPTFVILPSSGPVQVDSLAGFNGRISANPGATTPFYSGSTIIQKWNALNRVKIVFNTFTLSKPTEAGAPMGCKSLAKFMSSAGPAFKADLGDGESCAGCHGVAPMKPGDPIDLANQAFDIRTLDADPATACAAALLHVNPKNKPNSELILTCTGGSGGDPTHPVRGICGMVDAGDPDAAAEAGAIPQCVPQSVITGLLDWVNAE